MTSHFNDLKRVRSPSCVNKWNKYRRVSRYFGRQFSQSNGKMLRGAFLSPGHIALSLFAVTQLHLHSIASSKSAIRGSVFPVRRFAAFFARKKSLLPLPPSPGRERACDCSSFQFIAYLASLTSDDDASRFSPASLGFSPLRVHPWNTLATHERLVRE